MLLLRCSSTSEIVCGDLSDRTSEIKMEAGKDASGVVELRRWVSEGSMVSICSVGRGGDWLCSSVAIGAYTGPLVLFGGAVDVEVVGVCVEEAKSMICGEVF